MLRHLKFGWLLAVLMLFVVLTALPASAQTSAPGLDVDITESGVSVYRVNVDGSRSLIIFVPAIDLIVDTTAGQGGGMAVSEDVLNSGYLIVNTFALNVRSGPGAQYTVVATVAGGDELAVIGQNDGRENWWYVELANGQRGWVNNIHVLIRGDLRNAPVIPNEGILIQATLYIGYTGNPIFPSVPHNGVALCYLPGRSEFPIVGRSSQSSFYQIIATCQDGTIVTGWVEAQIGIVRNPAGTEFPVTTG